MPQLTPTSPLRIGILTVSDRASAGLYEDRGGPAIRDYLGRLIDGEWEPVAHVVADERGLIAEAVRALVDTRGCALVLATGGTGPAIRDVTPDAFGDAADRHMPGFGEAMRAASLAKVPTAILSRQSGYIRGQALLLTLPGNPKAIAECLDAVMAAVPYCVDLLGGPYIRFRPDAAISAFRPKHAAQPPEAGAGRR
jgi:molybdopterin adenylyltransferase